MKRTVALVALSAIVSHSLARSTYPILLPAIEDELLDNHQQSGILSTVNFAAYLTGVLLVTMVSGRLEPRRLLNGGMATAGLGFAALATAGGFWTLAAGQTLAGLGSAGIWMSAPVIATSAVADNRRGTVMGLLSSTMGLGIVASSQGTNLARALQSDDQAWRPTWVGAAVYAFVLLTFTVSLLRAAPTASVSGGISLVRLRSIPAWLPLSIGYWLFGILVSSFSPFFGAALEEKGLGRSHVSNLYALFGLAAVFGAVTLGRISDRAGRRPVLLGSMVVMAGASLLVPLGREPYATVAAILFGAASFTFPVLITAYLSDHLRDRALANALGALTLIYGSALVLGPVVSGTVGDSTLGFDVLFPALAVVAGLASIVLRRLPATIAGPDSGKEAGRRASTTPTRRPASARPVPAPDRQDD